MSWLSLDSWNNVIVGFLALGAFSAVIVGIATYVAFQLQKQETKDVNEALERYKIGVAAQVADAKKEGIEAGKTAGDALVRAAALEKEAAEARLATEKLKAQLSWRTLSKETGEILEAELRKHAGKVNLRYTDGDPEALFLAIQLSQALGKAQWAIAPGAIKLANAISFGISLPDSEGDDARSLRDAFRAAAIPFSTEPLPPMGAGFSMSTIAGAPTLMVGSKSPPLP